MSKAGRKKSSHSEFRIPNSELTLTALMAALIAALVYFGRIPFPMTSGGIVHPGDGMIFIAACLLPTPYAAVAASLGAGMADALLGDFGWLPATIALKACMALLFSSKQKKILTRRNVLVLLPACAINIAGYYLYEGFIYNQWAALVSVFGNVIQSGLSAALFLLLAAALDRLKLKDRLL